ncbi:MAG TPA: M48 family metallopeptidase [Ignavibacteria bacterium]|mgnify:CR=1 FL=1|nr:M48 family metallopeptidase [Ignavibacteria bacterium]
MNDISLEEKISKDNLSEEQRAVLAKKYSKTNQILSVAETLIFFAVILILLFTGLSLKIESIAFGFTSSSYIALLIFFGIIGVGEGLITFPMGFYSDYILEHKYDLSNQTLSGYFIEKLKGFSLGIILGIPLMFAFYYILQTFGENWWLVLGIFMFIVSVIIGRLAPTLLMPIFYKFKPIEDESLKNRILDLCQKAGVKINGIFTFDMSKNTKKANAAFTGMGKSKRIILGDTLISNFTEDEIEMVFAHEMGHYTKKHILKMMVTSTILTFAGLFITAKLYEASLGYFGFESVSQIAALPLLFLYLSLYGLITTPISNIQSRKFEWEADTYALETTKDKASFISAMEKLAGQNLSDKSPNKIIEYLFHSHPSIEKRIQFAKDFTF